MSEIHEMQHLFPEQVAAVRKLRAACQSALEASVNMWGECRKSSNGKTAQLQRQLRAALEETKEYDG